MGKGRKKKLESVEALIREAAKEQRLERMRQKAGLPQLAWWHRQRCQDICERLNIPMGTI